MRGFYYPHKGEYIIIIPYVLSGRLSDEGMKISFEPNDLERGVLFLRQNWEAVSEKLRFGVNGWTSFSVGERYTMEITNHCFKGRVGDAFRIARNLIECIVKSHEESKKDGN